MALLVRLALIAGLGAVPSCRSQTPSPNIVLVSIDALRADHVGAYGYSRGTTDFIDSLARDGSVFLNAFVPLPATGPSHASLLTSLHPLQHGVKSNAVRLRADVETLAEALKKRGYFTMGAVSVFHLGRQYQFDQGFVLYSDAWNAEEPLSSRTERSAPQVTRAVLEMVDEYARQRSAAPFFLFIHYFDVHAPYLDHDHSDGAGLSANSRSANEQEARIRRYDSEVRYVDEQLRRVYDYLDERGLTEHTYFAITADHGEQLGEHGLEEGHADLYRETIRVPLILRGPGIAAEKRQEVVSSMDLGVSLLDSIGGEYASAVSGVSFAGTGRRTDFDERKLLVLGYPAYARSLALVSHDRVYIQNLDRFYQYLGLKEITHRGVQPPGRGWSRAQPIEERRGAVRYTLPLLASIDQMKPVYVAARVFSETPDCRSSLAVHVEPNLDYLAVPLDFNDALEVHVPAVPLRDDIGFTVSGCPGVIDYQLRPFESMDPLHERLPAGYEILSTDLWEGLLTARKRLGQDELYDFRTDPGMENNLIGDGERAPSGDAFVEAIARMWLELSRSGPGWGAPSSHTAEELEMLRSLGYVR